jgi:hypothetical protein
MEGSFNLTTLPKHVVFYLEGPPPGVNLLIDSITISYKVLQSILCLPTYELDYEVTGLMFWTMINNMLVYTIAQWPWNRKNYLLNLFA